MRHLRVFLIACVILVLTAMSSQAQSIDPQLTQIPPIVSASQHHLVVENVSGIPKRVVYYEPPVIYKKWWNEVQECTGLKTPDAVFKKLKYRMVVADAFIADHDSTFLFSGLTLPWFNTITVTLNGVTSERLIKHEMTHIQMYHNGISAGHPNIYFQKCQLLNP